MTLRLVLVVCCIILIISYSGVNNVLAMPPEMMGQALPSLATSSTAGVESSLLPSAGQPSSQTSSSSPSSPSLPEQTSSSSSSQAIPTVGTSGQLQGMYNTTFTPMPEWISRVNLPYQFNSNEAAIIDRTLNEMSLGIMVYSAMRPQMTEAQLQAFYNQVFPLFKCISKFNVTSSVIEVPVPNNPSSPSASA